MKQKVDVWEEMVMIPTYRIGKPDKNPMFFEKRVYQGSSGVVYPYPVVERIFDDCQEQPYHALFLENEYLKIMILPELGGRVQTAYDKIKQRHFIYYNHVIKPALVGLTGPWISGGIEFNWPQHHRPSTFLPVDYKIERPADGSVQVWVNERERMFHQKGMAGFTLRPGRAVLEIQGILYNPTPFPQTFLWWANPAVAVNDHYQSVFPGDVNAVFDHGKRDVSRYPVATGTYYKMDYSAGVDISKYKNIPVPTSYMAIHSRYDFVGGYENDTQAGVLHVANHHISPGKKQWTWGCGDFGKAWDRNLTDADGPYIELMTGVYTDNQPDFTWLQPYEEKRFTQYFMPYRELGMVKNATADLLMNIEPEAEGQSILKLFATSQEQGVHVQVLQNKQPLLDTVQDLSPENVFQIAVPTGMLEGIAIHIYNSTGKCILSWQPEPDVIKPVPEPAKAALAPEDIRTTEQLYLTGLHLEQYRHATYSPVDYYQEALRRDPSDIRNNNAMGLWLLRRGQFGEAERYFRKAVETWTERNPNPYDGEPLYNLGLCLKYQHKVDEAYAYFYKACWNAAWQDAGYFSLAQISAGRGDWECALDEINRSLLQNVNSLRARHLKSTILRHLGRKEEALAWIESSLAIDPFNYGCSFEKYLLTGDENLLEALSQQMRGEAHNYEELVTDYISNLCWKEAEAVATWAIRLKVSDCTLLHYYLAWIKGMLGQEEEAKQLIQEAETLPQDTFFPNTLEAQEALTYCTHILLHTPKAWYLLGNILYDKRIYDKAIEAWETSIQQDDKFPTVFRNLALAYYNKQGKKEEAVRFMERAYELDRSDARILMELDQLYKRQNVAYETRLSHLQANMEAVCQRDDLYLEYATLLNQLGRYDEAIQWIDQRQFHPWEGGEGKVPAQYQIARLGLVRQLIKEKNYTQALRWLEECYVYPPHLGEGKLQGTRENELDYLKGCIYEGLADEVKRQETFEKALAGQYEPTAAMYYNDQRPDVIYYQGLAARKLGREEEACSRFHKLVDFGERHLFDVFKMDYFAVSLPDLQIWEDDMDKKNRVHCLYLMGLGHLGLGNQEKATKYLQEAYKLDGNHQGIQKILISLENGI